MTLTELRQLERAATPRPWKWGWQNTTDRAPQTYTVEAQPGVATLPEGGCIIAATSQYKRGFDDADLIVAARNALPALLDVVEAARFGPHAHTCPALLWAIKVVNGEKLAGDPWICTCWRHDLEQALSRLFASPYQDHSVSGTSSERAQADKGDASPLDEAESRPCGRCCWPEDCIERCQKA